MGLFHFGKKSHLLDWQRIIMADSPDKLVMTEAQLKSASNQLAQNDLRIIHDCVDILNTTTKPDTFFSRLDLMKETAAHLARLEPYVSFSGASPTKAAQEIQADEQEAIYRFIVRYFGDVFEKAEVLKTEAGKQKRYQGFYDSLAPYFDRMNARNQSYVRYKYQSKVNTANS